MRKNSHTLSDQIHNIFKLSEPYTAKYTGNALKAHFTATVQDHHNRFTAIVRLSKAVGCRPSKKFYRGKLGHVY